jgi:O-antigen/teichoic acid export membrane protein
LLSSRVRLFSRFITTELIIQAIGLVSGLFLIRVLDQSEYAYYIIANSLQSTMNQLSDMGIGSGLSALGGKVWQDRYRFGQLINTALQLRYYLASIAVLVAAPILIWMLTRSGTSFSYAGLITILVLIGLNFQLTSGVLEVVPRLHSQVNRIQHLNLLSNIARLLLLGLAYLSTVNAAIAVMTTSIVFWFQRAVWGRWANENIDKAAPISHEDQKFILGITKNLAPTTIFFCLQGQVTILLITLFGNTQSIAEIGALGRLAVIFSVANSVMSTIVLPGFSRCQEPSKLRRRYFQVLGIFILSGMVLLGITIFFPSQILWILGNKYAHLQDELFLMVLSTVATSVVGIMSLLNSAKAWVQYAWAEIPLRLCLQAGLLLWLDLSSVNGVLLFGLISNLSPCLINLILSYRGLTSRASFSC